MNFFKDCSLSDEKELNYENMATNVKDEECAKTLKEECDKAKILVKIKKIFYIKFLEIYLLTIIKQ